MNLVHGLARELAFEFFARELISGPDLALIAEEKRKFQRRQLVRAELTHPGREEFRIRRKRDLLPLVDFLLVHLAELFALVFRNPKARLLVLAREDAQFQGIVLQAVRQGPDASKRPDRFRHGKRPEEREPGAPGHGDAVTPYFPRVLCGEAEHRHGKEKNLLGAYVELLRNNGHGLFEVMYEEVEAAPDSGQEGTLIMPIVRRLRGDFWNR